MAKTPPPEGYLFSKGYTSYVFLLLWLLYFFDYVDRMVVVSLFPFLKSDWGLSDAQCGAMVSAVYWAIVIFSFPISIVIDRWSRKKSIGIMALLWSLSTAVCALTKTFGQLFAARTAIGLGEAGYAPGGTAMISALYPEKRRAFMLGIWNMSIPFGMAAGIVLGGYIATHWGWPSRLWARGPPGPIHCPSVLLRKGLPDRRPGTNGGSRNGGGKSSNHQEKDVQNGYRPGFCSNAFSYFDLLRVRRDDVHFHIHVLILAYLFSKGPGSPLAKGHIFDQRNHAHSHHRISPGRLDC